METNAIKLANRLEAEYWAVSSKTGENINDMFNRIAALAFINSVSTIEPSCAPQISSDLVCK